MKKSDKILGIVAVIAIICLVIYLIQSNLFSTAPKEAIYAAAGIFLVAIFGFTSHFLIIGLILRSRVVSFKKIGKQYSLEHSSDSSKLFIPTKKLNYLRGNINGKQVELFDEQFIPNRSVANDDAVMNALIPGRTLNKSINMRTKILLDGVDRTPQYKQKFIFYRNPFMKISQVEKYLETI